MQLPEIGTTMWYITESLKNGRNYVVEQCIVTEIVPKWNEVVLLGPHGDLYYHRPKQKYAYFTHDEAVQAAHRMADADNPRWGWMGITEVIDDA